MSDLRVNMSEADVEGPDLIDQLNKINGYLKPMVGANSVESLVLAAGGTQVISDPTANNKHFYTFGAGNITFTFPNASLGRSFILALKQDGVGSRTVTWPSNATVRWPGGTAPTLTTAAGKTDYFRFECLDGTHWDGSTIGLNY